MKNQKFVVWTQPKAEINKFTGFNTEGKKTGESMTLGDAARTERWTRDPVDGQLWKSFKVINPHWDDGVHACTYTNDVRLKFESTDAWQDAFEVTFLLAPNRFGHPRNERAWIKRVVLGGDTTLELQIPDDWPEDKFWCRFAHPKVSELKVGDFLYVEGKAIDGEEGLIMNHTVQILGVSFLGKQQMVKLEVTENDDCWGIWIDGIPFTRPLSEEEMKEIERLGSGLNV